MAARKNGSISAYAGWTPEAKKQIKYANSSPFGKAMKKAGWKPCPDMGGFYYQKEIKTRSGGKVALLLSKQPVEHDGDDFDFPEKMTDPVYIGVYVDDNPVAIMRRGSVKAVLDFEWEAV